MNMSKFRQIWRTTSGKFERGRSFGREYEKTVRSKGPSLYKKTKGANLQSIIEERSEGEMEIILEIRTTLECPNTLNGNVRPYPRNLKPRVGMTLQNVSATRHIFNVHVIKDNCSHSSVFFTSTSQRLIEK